MIRAPLGNHRVESECHHAGSICVTICRKFLYRHLCFCKLKFTTIRHEHCRAADGRVEHLDQALLANHVGVAEVIQEFFFQCLSFHLSCERILLLHSSDLSLRIMFGSGTVNEFALKICHDFISVEHPHAFCISNISHMSNFHVLAVAVFHELGLVLSLYDYRHSFLRLTDSQLSSIQSVIFYRDSVEIDVESVCKLSDSHADSTCSEVVGFLDKFSHFRTAEKSLELSLLRSIALLNLTSASFERLLCMFLG